MNVNLIKAPFPHMIVDDFFAPNEYDSVWHELEWLRPKLQDRERYLGEESERAAPVNQYGVNIEDLLRDSRRFSDIVLCYNKIFIDSIAKQLLEFDPVYNFIGNVSNNITAVRAFSNFDTLTKHRDGALFTAIYHTNKLETLPRGGVLIFGNSDYEITLKDNQLIMFPSYVEYEISSVEYAKDDDYSFMITRLMW
jgi:hypothetical protein